MPSGETFPKAPNCRYDLLFAVSRIDSFFIFLCLCLLMLSSEILLNAGADKYLEAWTNMDVTYADKPNIDMKGTNKQDSDISDMDMDDADVADTDMEDTDMEGTDITDTDSFENETRRVALTFDDGPNVLYTAHILDILKEKGIKATFFLIGKNAEAQPELVERILAEGHLIGNHTYSHLQLTSSNQSEFLQEVETTNNILEAIANTTIEFVRPPFGTWSKGFEKQLDMIPVGWTIDTKDWNSSDVETIFSKATENIKDGDIILMHDCYESTRRAVERIIDELLRQGFVFVTVDELITAY